MSNAEISMEYAQMENAAQVFGAAGQAFKTIAQKMQQSGEVLKEQAFVGGTGNSALATISGLVARLNDMSARAIEMQSDINKNVASFRGDVDPGIAQRFNT